MGQRCSNEGIYIRHAISRTNGDYSLPELALSLKKPLRHDNDVFGQDRSIEGEFDRTLFSINDA